MHILIVPSEHFVTEKKPLGGIFQFEQAKSLIRGGHKVGVISVGFISVRYLLGKYSYRKKENLFGIGVYRFYSRSFLIERFVGPKLSEKRVLKNFSKVFEKYKKEHGLPDVVYAHNFLNAGYVANFLFEKYKIPFVLVEHSSAFLRGEVKESFDFGLKKIARNAKELMCVSNSFKKVLENRFESGFSCFPNMVDPIFFDGNINEKGNENFVFINVAALDNNKNQKNIIKAFALNFKDKPFILKIIGDGPLKYYLMKLAVELGVGDQIIFKGQLSRNLVSKEMCSANCFILSSYHETFGVVLIEALASGLPLISTRCGGPEDIVNKANGILVSVDNSKELCEAMLNIAENYSIYDRHILRMEAKEKFSDSAFLTNIENILYKAVKNDRNY